MAAVPLDAGSGLALSGFTTTAAVRRQPKVPLEGRHLAALTDDAAAASRLSPHCPLRDVHDFLTSAATPVSQAQAVSQLTKWVKAQAALLKAAAAPGAGGADGAGRAAGGAGGGGAVGAGAQRDAATNPSADALIAVFRYLLRLVTLVPRAAALRSAALKMLRLLKSVPAVERDSVSVTSALLQGELHHLAADDTVPANVADDDDAAAPLITILVTVNTNFVWLKPALAALPLDSGFAPLLAFVARCVDAASRWATDAAPSASHDSSTTRDVGAGVAFTQRHHLLVEGFTSCYVLMRAAAECGHGDALARACTATLYPPPSDGGGTAAAGTASEARLRQSLLTVLQSGLALLRNPATGHDACAKICLGLMHVVSAAAPLAHGPAVNAGLATAVLHTALVHRRWQLVAPDGATPVQPPALLPAAFRGLPPPAVLTFVRAVMAQCPVDVLLQPVVQGGAAVPLLGQPLFEVVRRCMWCGCNSCFLFF